MLISGALNFDLEDEGLTIKTDKRDFKVQFDDIKIQTVRGPNPII